MLKQTTVKLMLTYPKIPQFHPMDFTDYRGPHIYQLLKKISESKTPTEVEVTFNSGRAVTTELPPADNGVRLRMTSEVGSSDSVSALFDMRATKRGLKIREQWNFNLTFKCGVAWQRTCNLSFDFNSGHDKMSEVRTKIATPTRSVQ